MKYFIRLRYCRLLQWRPGPLVDPRGMPGMLAHSPISFIFMQFSGEIGPKICWHPHLWSCRPREILDLPLRMSHFTLLYCINSNVSYWRYHHCWKALSHVFLLTLPIPLRSLKKEPRLSTSILPFQCFIRSQVFMVRAVCVAYFTYTAFAFPFSNSSKFFAMIVKSVAYS